MSLFRRIRAAGILALLWGAVWAIGGAGLGYYRARYGGYEFHWVRGPGDVARFALFLAAAWGGIGAFNGLAFASVLATLGRRAGRQALTPSQVARWGALAGLVLPAAFSVYLAAAEAVDLWPGALILLSGGAFLGGVCALGTLALAGHSTREPSQVESGAPAT